MHLNNKSSPQKKTRAYDTCLHPFFSLRAVSKTSAFGVLWLCSHSCCLRLKAHGHAETRPAIGQDHFPRTAPLLYLTILTAPSLPHSHCHEEIIFLFFFHPAVSHMAFTTLWCIGPLQAHFYKLSIPQCLHSSAALSPSVTLGWRCSHYLRLPGKCILLH